MKRRPNGTFVGRGAVLGNEEAGQRALPAPASRDAGEVMTAAAPFVLPPSPPAGACRQFVRQQIAGAMPQLCHVLIAMALNGDLGAFKLLWGMAELDQKAPGAAAERQDTGFARRAMAEFRAR